PGEDVERELSRRFGQWRRLEQAADVAPGADDAARLRSHIDPRRGHALPGHALAEQLHRLDSDRIDRGLDGVERYAGVNDRAEAHVTAGARKAVPPTDSRHRCPRARSRASAVAVRRATRAAKTPAPKPLSMPTTTTPGAHELSIVSIAARPPKDA